MTVQDLISLRTEKLINITAVADKTGMSAPTLFKLIKAGRFPSKVSINGGAVKGSKLALWRETDIDEWIRSLAQVEQKTTA